MRPAAFQFECATSLTEAVVRLVEGDGPDLVVISTSRQRLRAD
jgi:hypothetical protein